MLWRSSVDWVAAARGRERRGSSGARGSSGCGSGGGWESWRIHVVDATISRPGFPDVACATISLRGFPRGVFWWPWWRQLRAREWRGGMAEAGGAPGDPAAVMPQGGMGDATTLARASAAASPNQQRMLFATLFA